MKKKVFIALFLVVIFTREIFAQQLERLTYEEIKSDGTFGRTITVEAVFLGWLQQKTFMEGNYQVTYQCSLFNGEWSDWELKVKAPAIFLTISQYFWTLQRAYNLHPKSGGKFYMDGMEIIKVFAIPNGYSSPIWWAEDGRSFYTFFKLYIIKP